jgi:hypothetical protein
MLISATAIPVTLATKKKAADTSPGGLLRVMVVVPRHPDLSIILGGMLLSRHAIAKIYYAARYGSKSGFPQKAMSALAPKADLDVSE